MPTVYALDRRHKQRVRHRGVVHIAMAETISFEGNPGRPWSTRCRIEFGEITLEYLHDDDPAHVTCVACLGDRRKT